MMPNLASADSVAIMYYNAPNDPRFFKYLKEYDLRKMQHLISDANGKVITEKKACATRGKIYFYGKRGSVDVLYFSNKEGCMTLSFIITGEKYFVNMSKVSNDLLNDLQHLAKEPVSKN